ncbi:(2Fe-2S)-binding protein [Paucibacter oligotrophus]|uniref:Bacterioferritin-associated ferredoxin n=1 Tax=Roseateles oligotrophus TaxID=1769250 RepID=A0ABT2Y8R0_9BURK|nr:(2Fe-2S)-binding protein [Roseateles oligotrophus]MCV2366685.1 (2Fe-2S)-binding protein [Roseateles oligotrophus]
MIVCLCHRVSDRDIKRSVAEGISNFELLQDETGVASACACCLDCAREVFDAALAKSGCAGGRPERPTWQVVNGPLS